MRILTDVSRDTYGHDVLAINKHTERRYRDQEGNLYVLSRTLDGTPPFFEAYGPFMEGFEGALPRLRVMGREYWGDGWNWRTAVIVFCNRLSATIRQT